MTRVEARSHRRSRRALLLTAGVVTAGALLVAPALERMSMPPGGLPSGTSWRQTFNDDFDGDTLRTDAWTPSRYGEHANEAPYNPDKEGAYYKESSVTVAGGEARLRIEPADPWIMINGKAYGWSSGVMTTRGRFMIRPGDFVEARLWVPRGSGLWPAFWASPQDGSWPPELDILEFFDTENDARPYLSYLSEQARWDGPTAYGDPSTDYREGWHIFGLHWQSDGALVPYVDGVARHEVEKSADTSRSMFLILNLALQEGHTPPPGAELRVDWVRAYSPSELRNTN